MTGEWEVDKNVRSGDLEADYLSRGSGLVSRLYNHHSERLLGLAVLALELWYYAPQPDFNLDEIN